MEMTKLEYKHICTITNNIRGHNVEIYGFIPTDELVV
jgi:hypothetical protein